MQLCIRSYRQSEGAFDNSFWRKIVQYKQCDFVFVHLKFNSGEKSYKCEQCDFASATSSDFRNRKKTHTGEKSHLCTYLIFVLFSPQTKFLAQFFSTPKRVNRDKTEFAIKQRKSHKREILQQNSIKCDKTSKIVHIIYFVHNILI